MAVDAPAASYLMHVGPAMDAGVTVEQIQNILIAVAPIVGTPRTVSPPRRSPRRWASSSPARGAELEAEEAER